MSLTFRAIRYSFQNVSGEEVIAQWLRFNETIVDAYNRVIEQGFSPIYAYQTAVHAFREPHAEA